MCYRQKQKPKNSPEEEHFPYNCQDLNDLGHTVNGFYLVKNDKLATISSENFQTKFCDFKNSPSSAPGYQSKRLYLYYIT